MQKQLISQLKFNIMSDQPQAIVNQQSSQQSVFNSESHQQSVLSKQPSTHEDDSKPINIQQSTKVQNNITEPQIQVAQQVPQQQPITVNLFNTKLDKANSLKSEGNIYFKNKDYAQAIKTYTQGLQQLSPNHFYGATKEQCEKMAQLSSILLFNMGTCYFNSYDWLRAQIFYTEAITINPKYTKALHKRSLARYELMKYDEAFSDIKQAFSQDKGNGEIYKSYQKILQKYNEWVRQSKKHAKTFSQNIFKESKKVQSPTKNQNKQNNKEKDSGKDFSWGGLASGITAVGLIGFTLYKFLQK